MDTERDAFVSSLAKFTYLTTIKEREKAGSGLRVAGDEAEEHRVHQGLAVDRPLRGQQPGTFLALCGPPSLPLICS